MLTNYSNSGALLEMPNFRLVLGDVGHFDSAAGGVPEDDKLNSHEHTAGGEQEVVLR